jgi:hypothetical protein
MKAINRSVLFGGMVPAMIAVEKLPATLFVGELSSDAKTRSGPGIFG